MLGASESPVSWPVEVGQLSSARPGRGSLRLSLSLAGYLVRRRTIRGTARPGPTQQNANTRQNGRYGQRHARASTQSFPGLFKCLVSFCLDIISIMPLCKTVNGPQLLRPVACLRGACSRVRAPSFRPCEPTRQGPSPRRRTVGQRGARALSWPTPQDRTVSGGTRRIWISRSYPPRSTRRATC